MQIERLMELTKNYKGDIEEIKKIYYKLEDISIANNEDAEKIGTIFQKSKYDKRICDCFLRDYVESFILRMTVLDVLYQKFQYCCQDDILVDNVVNATIPARILANLVLEGAVDEYNRIQDFMDAVSVISNQRFLNIKDAGYQQKLVLLLIENHCKQELVNLILQPELLELESKRQLELIKRSQEEKFNTDLVDFISETALNQKENEADFDLMLDYIIDNNCDFEICTYLALKILTANIPGGEKFKEGFVAQIIKETENEVKEPFELVLNSISSKEELLSYLKNIKGKKETLDVTPKTMVKKQEL